MSERPESDTGDDGEGAEVEEREEPDSETPPEPDEGEEGEEERPKKTPEDWEKRAHNHAGQAARERSRRRAAERRASELQAQLAQANQSRGGDSDELLELIGELRDDEEDPIGDIAGVKRALKLIRARQLAESEQTEQQQRIAGHLEALRGAMSEAEEDFAVDHADYYEAAHFYRKARLEELQDAGYAGRSLERKLADDLFGVVRMAVEGGLDPAERVYALAAKRGYKAGGKMADKKLETLQRASDTGKRAAPGATGNGALSWGDVAKLDGAARDKAWAKLREREMSRKG